VSTGPQSTCEPYRHIIEAAVAKGMSAQRIWQDLRDDYHFNHEYASVKPFVRRIKRHRPEVAAVMEHPPGEEAQIDFFRGALTLDPESGRWRRSWIFQMVLSCCGHSYEELTWRQDKVSFLRPDENAFPDRGGVPRTVRLDNLKAGVGPASLYDPDIAELYAAFAKHWDFIPPPL